MSNARTQFIEEIERFMRKHDMDATAFGRLCLNDFGFVNKLKAGRNPRLDTVEEVRLFMKNYKQQARPKSRPLAGAAA